jgi:hypothetical protein
MANQSGNMEGVQLEKDAPNAPNASNEAENLEIPQVVAEVSDESDESEGVEYREEPEDTNDICYEIRDMVERGQGNSSFENKIELKYGGDVEFMFEDLEYLLNRACGKDLKLNDRRRSRLFVGMIGPDTRSILLGAPDGQADTYPQMKEYLLKKLRPKGYISWQVQQLKALKQGKGKVWRIIF